MPISAYGLGIVLGFQVQINEFFHHFGSRGFASISWVFLFLYTMQRCLYVDGIFTWKTIYFRCLINCSYWYSTRENKRCQHKCRCKTVTFKESKIQAFHSIMMVLCCLLKHNTSNNDSSALSERFNKLRITYHVICIALPVISVFFGFIIWPSIEMMSWPPWINNNPLMYVYYSVNIGTL